MGNSVTARRKSWEKILILGSNLKFRGQNLGYLSPIFLEAKFGAPTRISEANFGAKPPRPPNMEVPPLGEKCQKKQAITDLNAPNGSRDIPLQSQEFEQYGRRHFVDF